MYAARLCRQENNETVRQNKGEFDLESMKVVNIESSLTSALSIVRMCSNG
jgi:hypothetical protein